MAPGGRLPADPWPEDRIPFVSESAPERVEIDLAVDRCANRRWRERPRQLVIEPRPLAIELGIVPDERWSSERRRQSDVTRVRHKNKLASPSAAQIVATREHFADGNDRGSRNCMSIAPGHAPNGNLCRSNSHICRTAP